MISFYSLQTRHKGIDIVLIRQNTEGEYSCLEHENVTGVVESLKIITRVKSERIARYAFEYAKKHNRQKVTAVHKANIMKLSDGLFLRVCGEIAKEYPEIKFDNMIIDNCSMQVSTIDFHAQAVLTLFFSFSLYQIQPNLTFYCYQICMETFWPTLRVVW